MKPLCFQEWRRKEKQAAQERLHTVEKVFASFITLWKFVLLQLRQEKKMSKNLINGVHGADINTVSELSINQVLSG